MIEESIDPALLCACLSWHVHLVDVETTPAQMPTISPTLHQFLEKFLFWLEVLSVLGAVRNAVEGLQVITDWLKVCQVFMPDKITAVEREIKRREEEAPKGLAPVGSLMFSEVERRIDVVIFRSCLAHSVYEARRMVVHGDVLLNRQKVRQFSSLAPADR